MLEIILIVLGLIIFTCSFFLPAGKKDKTEGMAGIDEKEIRKMVEKEVDEAKGRIRDIVDETITYAMEKSERSMDRITNEKMMAVNEYSDTVLEQINKNHKEVVFLYDMLNDKHENLKSTVSEAMKTASEVKQTVKDAEITARSAEAVAKAAKETEAVKETTKVKDIKAEKEAKAVKAEKEVKAVKEIKTEKETEAVKETTEEKAKGKTRAKTKTGKEKDREVLEEAENVILPETEEKEFRPIFAERIELPKEEEVIGEAQEAVTSRPEIAVSLDSSGRGGRNSNERILELHKAGKSNMAIAKEMGLGIGEVKLVIDLFEGI